MWLFETLVGLAMMPVRVVLYFIWTRNFQMRTDDDLPAVLLLPLVAVMIYIAFGSAAGAWTNLPLIALSVALYIVLSVLAGVRVVLVFSNGMKAVA